MRPQVPRILYVYCRREREGEGEGSLGELGQGFPELSKEAFCLVGSLA